MGPKQFLQGEWLGHPLHPAIVHLPTALWPAALVFDILTRFDAGGNPLVRTSFYAVALGLVAALFAIPTGLADWWDIGRDKPTWKMGVWHLSINLVAVALSALNLYLRWNRLQESAVATAPLLLSLLVTGLLLVSGYIGGRMVYNYGASIARQTKDEWRRHAEAGGARVPQQGQSKQEKQ